MTWKIVSQGRCVQMTNDLPLGETGQKTIESVLETPPGLFSGVLWFPNEGGRKIGSEPREHCDGMPDRVVSADKIVADLFMGPTATKDITIGHLATDRRSLGRTKVQNAQKDQMSSELEVAPYFEFSKISDSIKQMAGCLALVIAVILFASGGRMFLKICLTSQAWDLVWTLSSLWHPSGRLLSALRILTFFTLWCMERAKCLTSSAAGGTSCRPFFVQNGGSWFVSFR